MDKLISLTLIILSSLIFTNPVIAQGVPPGSYQYSCNNIKEADDVLMATCRKLDDTYQQTSLRGVNACLKSITLNGDIGNIDGNLVCIPDLPDADPNINFPEAEITINSWVYDGNFTAIAQHGWGIWAGLTKIQGQVDGRPVRAFETWATLSNMLFRMQRSEAFLKAEEDKRELNRNLDLTVPRQFRNMKEKPGLKAAGDGDTGIFVSVAYNPPAARHAIANKLFLQSTLEQFLKDGYTEIPNFPNNAITIKPVYKIIPKNTPQGIYTFPGWPGTPDPAKTFGESVWGSCVYVNIKGSGQGGNSIDKGCKGRNATNTFYLNNFIHQPVSSEDANYLSTQLNLKVSEGDYAILVGMHVTTREVKRWAWQTFWWSANRDDPFLPSSRAIADNRPSAYLDAAASHYAMSLSYNMVSPAQPVIKGKNAGSPVIGYNPHLEAGFDPSVFQIKRAINGTILNQYGVQTNCMTCHGLAAYNPKTDYANPENREMPYAADFYLGLDDPVFDGKLKLDFAWSILGALKLDGTK